MFSSRSIMSFLTQKGPKTSAHGRCIHKCFLFMPRASFSQPLVRHGSLWFVCRVLRNSLHAGLGDNIYPRYAQTSSHNGLQPAPATIEHLNGAGFAFGDELPLLLKTPIRTNDNRGFQVPHLVAMVGLCCRFPFEYPCRSNFKNNPALLRKLRVNECNANLFAIIQRVQAIS